MDGEDDCGLYMEKISVKHPKYIPYIERKNSFIDYPKPEIIEKLVEAGFFYNGCSDETICFLCGLGMKQWLLDEEPWINHQTWNPLCLHVICNKDNSTFLWKKEKHNHCKFCNERSLEMLFIPCQHLICCDMCSKRIVFCLLCNKKVESTIKVSFS